MLAACGASVLGVVVGDCVEGRFGFPGQVGVGGAMVAVGAESADVRRFCRAL